MIFFESNQSIANFYYNYPHLYMSLIEILKYAIEHNTWKITQTLGHLQSSSSRMISL
jgi:hypothetical protein